MAWSDAARQASIAARQRAAQANGVAHQSAVGQVGQPPRTGQRVLDMIRNNPDGISVRPDGSQPSKGYMVSLPGRSKVLEGHDLLRHDADRVIDDYVNRNADALKNPNAHIGAWKDKATGKVYLDISENLPHKFTAIHEGKKRNQIAIYDVKRKREIRTGGTGE